MAYRIATSKKLVVERASNGFILSPHSLSERDWQGNNDEILVVEGDFAALVEALTKHWKSAPRPADEDDDYDPLED